MAATTIRSEVNSIITSVSDHLSRAALLQALNYAKQALVWDMDVNILLELVGDAYSTC